MYTKNILPNGLRVITIPMTGNPTVTVLVASGTGNFYEESSESGLSHFLEHMCFKGTSRRANSFLISNELDSIGAEYNAFTDSTITAYYAKADTKHFEKIADIITDVYLNSIFPEAEIEKEKGVVFGEIDMYADKNQQKIYDALQVHMYKGEVPERHTLGNKESVKSFSKQNLIDYRNSQYIPKNTVLVISGGIEESKMLEWANNFSGTWSEQISNTNTDINYFKTEIKTTDRTQENPELVCIEKDTDQAHILLSWRTFSKDNPDRFIASVIKGLLTSGMSSRLYMKLREELGSGYYVWAQHSTHTSFGNFTIGTGTTHERVIEIITAIKDEIRKLKEIDVSEEELNKVKQIIKSSKIMGLETSDNAAEFFGIQEITSDKLRTLEELDKLITKVTDQDIRRVANIIFDDIKLTGAVIGKGINNDLVSKALRA